MRAVRVGAPAEAMGGAGALEATTRVRVGTWEKVEAEVEAEAGAEARAGVTAGVSVGAGSCVCMECVDGNAPPNKLGYKDIADVGASSGTGIR